MPYCCSVSLLCVASLHAFYFRTFVDFRFRVYSFVSQGQGPGTAVAVTRGRGHDRTRPVMTADGVADFPICRRQK